MTKTLLAIIDHSSNTRQQVSASFPDDEWAKLEAYIQYADELASASLLQSAFFTHLKIQGDATGKTTFTTELPPWESVIVLLHKLRPFILNDEHASFNYVYGILRRRIEHEFFRNMLKEERARYDGRIFQAHTKIQINDEVLNSEKILMAWLNAYEYHRDQGKKKLVDSLWTMFPQEASKTIFIFMLLEKIRAIFNIAGLINVIWVHLSYCEHKRSNLYGQR